MIIRVGPPQIESDNMTDDEFKDAITGVATKLIATGKAMKIGETRFGPILSVCVPADPIGWRGRLRPDDYNPPKDACPTCSGSGCGDGDEGRCEWCWGSGEVHALNCHCSVCDL